MEIASKQMTMCSSGSIMLSSDSMMLPSGSIKKIPHFLPVPLAGTLSHLRSLYVATSINVWSSLHLPITYISTLYICSCQNQKCMHQCMLVQLRGDNTTDCSNWRESSIWCYWKVASVNSRWSQIIF